MELYEKLASDELVWVAHVIHLLEVLSPGGFKRALLAVEFRPSLLEVCFVELCGHLAPDLNALHFCQVTLVLEILPICFVEFRPD